MKLHVQVLAFVLAVQAIATVTLADPPIANNKLPYDPTDNYTVQQIEGWSVLVNKSFVRDEPQLSQQTLTHLQHQLYQIKRVVPNPALTKLQKINIWVEEKEPHHPCMAYHPDVSWLREHDMNPEKAKCVELAGARNFLTWTIAQPWMVLHELAHGYHDQFLDKGFDNLGILAAYKNAIKQKRYEEITHINGREDKAYAATNQMEYFAEASEAFFGTNDFYPFVKIELKQHDPELYEVLTKTWRISEERSN